ncbi:MerR family transcriptional regulator, partial [Streptomyces alkaliterrae]
MRIGELSERADVPVPTIKYYLREGLLPPGRRTSPNQARYDDSHLGRLRLIRALTQVGGLPVADAKIVLDAVDDPGRTPHKVLGAAQRGLTATYAVGSEEDLARARRVVADLIERRGWRVSPAGVPAHALAAVLATMRETGLEAFERRLDEYAEASERIAAADVAGTVDESDLEATVMRVVLGTLLGDAALAALRRLAQADASARHYGHGGPAPAGDGGDDEAGASG